MNNLLFLFSVTTPSGVMTSLVLALVNAVSTRGLFIINIMGSCY